MIPADAVLTKRPDEIPAYDDMPAALKPILAREMEVYAAFLEHTTTSVACSTPSKDMEVLDDTLIYYIFWRQRCLRGRHAERLFNEVAVLNGMGTLETPEFLMSKINDFGGPDAYNHYAVGWAHAMNTPYQWTKQVASHFGGTRKGTIVHWPRGIQGRARPVAVLPRDRHRADGPRGCRNTCPDNGEWHTAAPTREEHALCVECRQGTRTPRDSILRDVLQPWADYHEGWTAVTRHGIRG